MERSHLFWLRSAVRLCMIGALGAPGPSLASAQVRGPGSGDHRGGPLPDRKSASLPTPIGCELPPALAGRAADLGLSYRTLAFKAYQQGDWRRALNCLIQAQAYGRSARVLRAIGMSAYNLGEYVTAASHLQLALAESADPLDAPLRAATQELLAQVQRHIARVEMRLEPAAGEVLVNGRNCVEPDCAQFPVTLTPEGTQPDTGSSGAPQRLVLLVRPGNHVLRYQVQGRKDWESAMVVEPGNTYVVTVTLTVTSTAQDAERVRAGAVLPAPSVQQERPREEPGVRAAQPNPDGKGGSSRTQTSPRYWLIPAVGSASLLVTAGILGALGQVRYRELEQDCRRNPCGSDDVRGLDRWATATNVALGGAALLALGSLGTYWYESSRSPVRWGMGPTQLTVQGRF